MTDVFFKPARPNDASFVECHAYVSHKVAGRIVRIGGAYRYQPAGTYRHSHKWGPEFATLEECKRDVAGEPA